MEIALASALRSAAATKRSGIERKDGLARIGHGCGWPAPEAGSTPLGGRFARESSARERERQLAGRATLPDREAAALPLPLPTIALSEIADLGCGTHDRPRRQKLGGCRDWCEGHVGPYVCSVSARR